MSEDLPEDIWSYLNRLEFKHNLSPQTLEAQEKLRKAGANLQEFYADLSSHNDDTPATTGELRMALLQIQQVMAATNFFGFALATEMHRGNYPGGALDPRKDKPD